MGKVAPETLTPQTISQRTHSGRRYWVRNIPALAGDSTAPNATAKGVPPSQTSPSPKKRFVEPYRLTDEQREAMLAPLAERGIGDPESRELFAAALAYDLATCYELTVANPESEPAVAEAPTPTPDKALARSAKQAKPLDPALADLAKAAEALAGRISALDANTQGRLLQGLREEDPFRRGYDEAYLAALSGELMRVATGLRVPTHSSADAATPPSPPPKKAVAPKPSPAARQFIARAAGAFDECFDQAPTALADGPFAAMLKALIKVTGVRIPSDTRNLALLLKQG
jgi:hypothetical protein